MATMIPEVPDTSAILLPERLLYDALREQLDKRFTVFHSYPWLRRWRGDQDRPLQEGETDFLVLHPELGALVIEVKGGDVECDQRGAWSRRTSAGSKPIQNPFLQARKNMHALLELVDNRGRGEVRRGDLSYGYAVAFTQCDYRGQLPADADPHIVITSRHLDDVSAAVGRAFRAWTAAPRPLSAAQFQALLDALTPQFRFIRALTPEVEQAAQQARMLTASQTQAWEGLLAAAPRVLIQGPAGSGKTELAARSAARHAREGRRAALLCYNKELAAALQARLERDPETAPLLADGLLAVHSFHKLASDLARRAKVPFAPADGGQRDQRFWDEEAADILSQAAGVLEMSGEFQRFDAVVVDEGQDFRPQWWLPLRMDLLADGAPLQVFLDEHQSLWGEFDDSEFDGAWTRLRLDTNCRSTRKVAGFAAALADVDAATFEFAPEGVAPEVVHAADQSKQRGLALERVRRLLEAGLTPRQVALIGPAKKENGSLAGVDAVGNHALVTSPAAWRDGEGVLVTTARSFKGLEAAAVVVYDLGGLGELFTEADLYVACTRATYKLDLIVHDEDLRRRLQRAS